MMMAAKVVQCIASFSCASLSPALMLPRGIAARLRHRFVSSSRKDGKAAVKVDPEKRRIDANNFINKNKLNPGEVGNSLTAGILKQTTIMGAGSQLICLDMQATTSTVPRVLDAMLSVYTGLYGNPHPCTHTYGWETMKAIDVGHQQVAKLIGGHPEGVIFISEATKPNPFLIKCVAMIYKASKHIVTSQTEHMCVLDSCRYLQEEEYDFKHLPIKNNTLINGEHLEKVTCADIELASSLMVDNETGVIQRMVEIRKLCRQNGVFFCTQGAQSVVNILLDFCKWNDDLMSNSGPQVYGPKDIRACYIRHKPKVRMDPLMSGSCRERGFRSGTHAHSLAFAFGEPYRIAQEENEYTSRSKPFFSQNSICPSTMQHDNYIQKRYHNKQLKQFARTFWTMGHHKAGMKKSKPKATPEDSREGIQKANLKEFPNTKADKNRDKKRRNCKWATSFSGVTLREAEKLLGVRLNLPGTPVKEMLEGKSILLTPDMILKVKRKIYERLVDYVSAGGYPTEADADFNEANINDIVTFTIYPIIALFNDETKRELHLSREKEITSKDSSTSGREKFLVMDYISHDKMKYVLVVGAKKVSLGEARKQCFLAMKCMWDCNGGAGTVYGFVTMGDHWRMISYDGKFKISEQVGLLFDSMGKNEERWMADYSILIDCFNVALSNGAKGLVEAV